MNTNNDIYMIVHMTSKPAKGPHAKDDKPLDVTPDMWEVVHMLKKLRACT